MTQFNVEVGAIIAGRYEVLEEIGSGGMGIVMRCRDHTLDDIVALKVLHPHLGKDETIFKRFRNELLVARTLTHPNIVRLHDITLAEQGFYCISMEYVDGKSLKETIMAAQAALPASGGSLREFLSLQECIRMFVQVLLGVSYAHEKGVIHRDLKPANVLISKKGEAKLADFGTARIVGSDTSLTQAGQMIGTPDFMAPEQIRGEALDEACDIYALGLIAYELAVGTKPFEADSAVALAYKHLSEPIPSMSCEENGIPDWYEFLVRKACAKEKKERFASVADMLVLIGEHIDIQRPRTIPTGTLSVNTQPELLDDKNIEIDKEQHTSGVISTKVTHNRSRSYGTHSNEQDDDNWSWDAPTNKHASSTTVVAQTISEQNTHNTRMRLIVLFLLLLVAFIGVVLVKWLLPEQFANIIGNSETKRDELSENVSSVASSDSAPVEKESEVIDELLDSNVEKLLQEDLELKKQDGSGVVSGVTREVDVHSSQSVSSQNTGSSISESLASSASVSSESSSQLSSSSLSSETSALASVSSDTSSSVSSSSSESSLSAESSLSSLSAVSSSESSYMSYSFTTSSRAPRQVISSEKEFVDRALKEKELRERERRDREARERDLRERDARERELKDKELRERELREFRDGSLDRRDPSEMGGRSGNMNLGGEPEIASESFSGSLSSPNGSGGQKVSNVRFNLRFANGKISGDATIDVSGQYNVSGTVFPRGIEMILTSGTDRIRLTGTRRGNILRGSFYSSSQSSRGEWQAALSSGK